MKSFISLLRERGIHYENMNHYIRYFRTLLRLHCVYEDYILYLSDKYDIINEEDLFNNYHNIIKITTFMKNYDKFCDGDFW